MLNLYEIAIEWFFNDPSMFDLVIDFGVNVFFFISFFRYEGGNWIDMWEVCYCVGDECSYVVNIDLWRILVVLYMIAFLNLIVEEKSLIHLSILFMSLVYITF